MIASLQKLLEIAKTLRGPNGCPWDKSRTLLSLQKDFAEEADEVLAALKNEDDANLKEELGDVLFNILLMTTIAEEEKRFTLKAVLEGVTEKIVSRHTWVFGDDKATTPEEAIAMWKKNKAKEKSVKKSAEKSV